MNPAPAADDGDTPGDGADGKPVTGVSQEFLASGQAQQAVQGAGIQNVYLGDREAQVEPVVSIAAPVGQRDPGLPLRGRDVLLAELAGAGGGVRVVHGLGGCGKTRLALEAAFDAEQRGAQVWWISAADPAGLAGGMGALGRRLSVTDAELKHGDAADLIWQRLAARQEPWLLVLDNADDPRVLVGAGASVAEGRGWLRPVPGGAGRVLVTSRDGSPASWGPWCTRHQLGMLPVAEAAVMLADHAGQHPGLGSEEEARLLAGRLGGLPLAIKIAGSYLAAQSAIPTAFAAPGAIGTYRQYRNALEGGDLGTVFPAPGEEMTQEQARGLIGRTWDLTLDLLDARQLPETRPVLRLLASLADAPIPYQLLLRPEALAASPLLQGITGPRLWQALTALHDVGLIDLSPASEDPAAIPVARLHPLVRDTSRPAPATSQQITFLELAARLLGEAAAVEPGLPEDPPMWPAWHLLAPHAAHILDSLASLPDCPDDAAQAAAYAAYLAARYQAGQGLHRQAEALHQRVLAVRLRVLGPDHPHTLTARHQIALEMAERGDHAGAEAEYRDVLAARLKVLGPDHPSTLSTRHNIAAEMAERGDHAGAEAEYRDVLAARLRVLGPGHASTQVTARWVDYLDRQKSD